GEPEPKLNPVSKKLSPAAPARVRPRAHWPRPALRTGYEGAPESKAGSGFGFALLQPQIRSLIHDSHTAACPRAGVSSGAGRAQPGEPIYDPDTAWIRARWAFHPVQIERSPLGADSSAAETHVAVRLALNSCDLRVLERRAAILSGGQTPLDSAA